MTTTVLIIEQDDPALKLLAWGLAQEGFDVHTAARPEESGDGLRPQFIIFNTKMRPEDKQLWVTTMRYLVPGTQIVDLVEGGARSLADTGADAQLDEPFRVGRLVALLRQISPSKLELREEELRV